jgi:hypothetical protein
MARGDEMLLYAVGGYKKIFASARTTADPERDVPGASATVFKRWPHAVQIELGPHINYVEYGPELTDIRPDIAGEIRQGVSHFPISASDYQVGVRLIRKAMESERRKEP